AVAAKPGSRCSLDPPRANPHVRAERADEIRAPAHPGILRRQGLDIQRMRAADPRRFEMANAIRSLAMDAVQAAKSGHPGMPMGMADAATVLFDGHLKYDAENPDWYDRDRFVLSAGHGSMLLYSILHLTGHADMTLEELRN